MKALFWLFLFFTILTLPLMIIYSNGGGGLGRTQSGQFTDIFGKLALGNIGTSEMTCANINFAKNEKTFRLSCPYGTMRELFDFGLQRIDNQTCKD